MTSASKKRGPQTYNGLKVLLLTGGMGASVLGTRLIARNESSFTTQEPVSTETVEITPALLPEFSLGTLEPIPTIVSAYVAQEPTPEPTNAAPGNPPAQAQANAAPAAVESDEPVVPTVVAVGDLPPIPQPSSSGGGSGNSGSSNSGSGSSGGGNNNSGGGATSRSS
jgi:hypothetical protein